MRGANGANGVDRLNRSGVALALSTDFQLNGWLVVFFAHRKM